MTQDVLPGCEAYSADGGPHGVLVLHGITGNPSSMRSLAQRFAAAGYGVELPRLPGHGTSIEDMLTTDWSDWSGEALRAFDALAARSDKTAVVGLSMGGALAALVAEQRPGVAACVFINAVVNQQPPEVLTLIDEALAGGMTVFETGEGSDVRKEGVEENAYPGWPLAPLKSLQENLPAVKAALGSIRAPSLVLTSREDHTVPPENSLELMADLAGPVEHLWLEDSYHVATIDNDQELVESTALSFVDRVLGA
ncbi:MAG: alpha/beta fold hydrolase [Acidobacteriota bacterium]|nr:alpha/beta fold hydrolase [Acidobacteriota bacterium]